MYAKKMLHRMLAIILAAVILIFAYNIFYPRYVKTEDFIKKYMTNPNGTLSTYLIATQYVSPDIAHSRESLSESLGLWMQYAIVKQDQSIFENCYVVLNDYFLSPEDFVYWKISWDGRSDVTTNALIDDLRIIDALLTAEQVWGQAKWGQTARQIGRFMATHLVKDGRLVDFYDSKYNNSSDSITLSYLEPQALEKLRDCGILENTVYDQSIELIGTIPDDGVFFPKAYNVKAKNYTYDTAVNLVDQLLIARYRMHLGIDSPGLYAFVRDEYYNKGIIYGGYDRTTRTPGEFSESPAVYALAILYSLERGDNGFAVDLYKRMVRFRTQSGNYTGGYVTNGQTHIFDNLYPLLAEIRLYKTKLLLFRLPWD